MDDTKRLAQLDHEHLWHPFTAMRQWRQTDPLIIDHGQGAFLYDTEGNRYIDGVSSLWCNVHGHQVPQIDQAIRDQLGRIAHSTLLGLASPPSIELAERLCRIAPSGLNKLFYSDCGATAVELGLKIAVGYWYHQDDRAKNRFISMQDAYHGDTCGAMSVGFSDLFHDPFASMMFPVSRFPSPDPCRAPPTSDFRQTEGRWPSEDGPLAQALLEYSLAELRLLLERQAHETAAIVLEPIMQGAGGMICQPPGFVAAVARLAHEYNVLFVADEVATGFGRTGTMFACEQELNRTLLAAKNGSTENPADMIDGPDILCLAKGITGGYLPLAATLVTDQIEQAFCGEWEDNRTLYHGHTYTGNALSCAAALGSLDLIQQTNLLTHIQQSAKIIRQGLNPLRRCSHVRDVRQRGLMVGIELCQDRDTGEPLDSAKRTGAAICMAMRPRGLLIRPLGDVVVLMPIPAMDHETLQEMLQIVVQTIFDGSIS